MQQHEFPENYADLKKSNSERFILYDDICITLLKGQSYRNGKEISGCQGLRKRQEGGSLKILKSGLLILPLILRKLSQ